jgi:hypothetical protein
MSTRKLGTYATKEEFLENEIRTLNFYIQSMIDTMKVTSMNRQDMLEELERMKQEIKTAVLAEREACAKVCDKYAGPFNAHRIGECADAIRARGQA